MPIKEIKDIVLSVFKANPFKVIPKKRLIIGVILLLGIVLLLYQSLSPQILKLKAMRFISFSLKNLLDCKQRLAKDPAILLKDIENTKNQFNEVRSRFIIEKNLPNFFDFFRGLINKTGSRLVSLDVKPLIPIKELALAGAVYYQRLPLAITVSGDYISALLLLNRLEEEPFLMEIKNIKITSGGDSVSGISMSLEVDLYVFKD